MINGMYDSIERMDELQNQMRVGKWLVVVIVVSVAAFFIWAYIHATRQEQDLQVDTADSGAADISSGLQNRILVWTTNANVPLRLVWSDTGYDLLDLAGVPESVSPFNLGVGREPVRDEWNIAYLQFESGQEPGDVEYLTEDDGSYLHSRPSASGDYIVATMIEGESQDIAKISLTGRDIEIVAFSHSIDRWPSIGGNADTILFHSFRDGNPGGDLYLSVQENPTDGEWVTYRLTDNPDVEYVWPMMSADVFGCVAVERVIGEEKGKVILWDIDNRGLVNPGYPVLESTKVKHPSLSQNAKIFSWQELLDGIWSVVIWEIDDSIRTVIGPISDPPHPGHGWVQPTISPDGKYVTFVDDYIEAGVDRIGIYNLETDEFIYLEGCGGNVMFPSLTNQRE